MTQRHWIDPATAVARYREASALYKHGRFAEALTILEAVHEAYPRMNSVATALAMCREAVEKCSAPAGHMPAAESETPHAESMVEPDRCLADAGTDRSKHDVADDGAVDPAPAEPLEPHGGIDAPAFERVHHALVPIGPAVTVQRRRFKVKTPWMVAAGLVFGVLCGALFNLGRFSDVGSVRASGVRVTEAARTVALPEQIVMPSLPEAQLTGHLAQWRGSVTDDAVIEAIGAWNGVRCWQWGTSGYLDVMPPSGQAALVTVVVCPELSVERALCSWGVSQSAAWRKFAADAESILLAVPASAVAGDPEKRLSELVNAYLSRYNIEDARFLLVGEEAGAKTAWRFMEQRPERILAAALIGWAPDDPSALTRGWQAALPLVMLGATAEDDGRTATQALREAAAQAGAPARARYVAADAPDAEARARTVTGELLALLHGETPAG